jgi:hypothetical protein
VKTGPSNDYEDGRLDGRAEENEELLDYVGGILLKYQNRGDTQGAAIIGELLTALAKAKYRKAARG